MKFHVDHQWNGKASQKGIWANMEAFWSAQGMHLRFELPKKYFLRVPGEPVGYTDGLWEFDVAEIFFGFGDGSYIEFEIDREGHWLLLGFRQVRKRDRVFDTLPLKIETTQTDDLVQHRLLLPREVFPERPKTVNAYVIAGGEFLSYAPMPGEEADFHQPEAFVPFAC